MQQQQSNAPAETVDLDKIYQYINDLCNPQNREIALVELRLVFRLLLI